MSMYAKVIDASHIEREGVRYGSRTIPEDDCRGCAFETGDCRGVPCTPRQLTSLGLDTGAGGVIWIKDEACPPA
jgi:hypothetical protein